MAAFKKKTYNVIRNNRARAAFRKAMTLKRESMGLSQTDLAKDIGVHRQSIAYIESGHHRPTFDQVVVICKKLYMSFDQVMQQS